MPMRNRGHEKARLVGVTRPQRPYILPTSKEFLAILPEARRLLEDAALGQDGRPRRLGRPKGSKTKRGTP